MMAPLVTTVTKLDLDLFFSLLLLFIRLCPSLSPLFTYFIVFIIDYILSNLLLLKDKMKLYNHFVEGHPSSIKGTAADMRYFARSNFCKNLVGKRKISWISQVFSKLE